MGALEDLEESVRTRDRKRRQREREQKKPKEVRKRGDAAALGSLIRDTLITNRRADFHQKERAGKKLRRVGGSQEEVQLMSEFINSEQGVERARRSRQELLEEAQRRTKAESTTGPSREEERTHDH